MNLRAVNESGQKDLSAQTCSNTTPKTLTCLAKHRHSADVAHQKKNHRLSGMWRKVDASDHRQKNVHRSSRPVRIAAGSSVNMARDSISLWKGSKFSWAAQASYGVKIVTCSLHTALPKPTGDTAQSAKQNDGTSKTRWISLLRAGSEMSRHVHTTWRCHVSQSRPLPGQWNSLLRGVGTEGAPGAAPSTAAANRFERWS